MLDRRPKSHILPFIDDPFRCHHPWHSKVPQGCRSLKVQTWGGGGGSGHFKGGQCGEGGGGAFAEAILYVAPDDELEVHR